MTKLKLHDPLRRVGPDARHVAASVGHAVGAKAQHALEVMHERHRSVVAGFAASNELAVSRDSKLVTGSETGHDAAVPFVHYFEGMLSLGPYRVPDAGRDMARIASKEHTSELQSL